MSSSLRLQITHAVRAAYKFKLDALANKEKEVAILIVKFGNRDASSVIFHSAFKFSATLKAPMIFFYRNNGCAISTPVEDENISLCVCFQLHDRLIILITCNC